MAMGLGLFSFVLNVALIGPDPVATFYLPFTRAFELLAGAALARGWSLAGKSALASNWRAATGLALIVLAVGFLDSHHAFPGWWAILPVAGTVLRLSAPAAWLNRAVLASRPWSGSA